MDGKPVRITFTVRTTWSWDSIRALRFALKGMLRRLGLKCERMEIEGDDEEK
jgi:hypothetical protein